MFMKKCLNDYNPTKKRGKRTYLSDIDFKYFMRSYKDCTKEPYSFLVNDTTLSWDNPFTFRHLGRPYYKNGY